MDSGFNSISRLFDAIITLFGAVFGFLPPWVLVFVGSVCLFMLGVFVYKLFRG